MDKKVCPKMDTPLPFWEKTRGTRCFAELFWSIAYDTINAVAFSIAHVNRNLSREKIDDLHGIIANISQL